MDERTRTSLSKVLSLVLRHDPGAIGIALDAAGWTDVEALLEACGAHGRPLSREALEEVVATSPKRRFALSDDGTRIRASQGHSVEVELGYAPASPPPQLFHGTVAQALDSIRAQGLVRGERHHVHLSADEATARVVGARRGAPVLLRVDAGAMHRDGHLFYRSENGVWLTEAVPARYLGFPEGS
jgi:putative RNA 2'-phosphotransferase